MGGHFLSTPCSSSPNRNNEFSVVPIRIPSNKRRSLEYEVDVFPSFTFSLVGYVCVDDTCLRQNSTEDNILAQPVN